MRGLCMACYMAASRLVKQGKLTWELLERIKKAKPRAQGRQEKWFLEGATGAILLLSVLGGAVYADKPRTCSWFSYASAKREGTSGITASGIKMQDNLYLAASWDYPLWTHLRIRAKNGREVMVVVADRGPNRSLYRAGRILDLSPVAFEALAPLSQGVVELESVSVITYEN